MGDRVMGMKGPERRMPAYFSHDDDDWRDEENPSYHPITL
jgi:hypothetical protein